MKKFIVFFAAIAMVGAFAFSAVAADWSFYGSARMSTFSAERSKELVGTLGGNAVAYDDTDTTWDLQSNARLGANVDAGDVTGRFELGLQDETAAATGGVYARIIWGEWDFGGGKLGVGKHYTPLTNLYSGQAYGNDAGLLSYGAIYFGRKAMVQLTFGGFKVALVEPTGAGVTLDDGSFLDTNITIPSIYAKYKFKTDTFFVEGFGGYGSYDQVGINDKEYSIDSNMFGVGAGADFGAFYFKANVYAAQNGSALGSSEAETANAVYNATTDGFDDTDTIGYLALVGFKANDMLKFEAGYGATNHEVTSNGVETENDANSWYLQAVVTLAPGVFIVPEVGRLDLDDTTVGGVSTAQGDTTYFGCKWQINF